jgi:hypothetical protein
MAETPPARTAETPRAGVRNRLTRYRRYGPSRPPLNPERPVSANRVYLPLSEAPSMLVSRAQLDGGLPL